MLKKAERIAKWLKRMVDDAGAEGLVVGISGGVDSALVAALAVKACGDKALGLILPCNSAKEDEDSAQLVVRATGIRCLRIDLDPAVGHLINYAEPEQEPNILQDGYQLGEANAKSRMRMVALYYYANALNYLVVGTTNKPEMLLGYFTKYGDGAVDLEPISTLLKREVREMASALGIPEEVVNRTPSAGLWPGQTDEDEMGMKYVELDAVLSGEGEELNWVRKKMWDIHRMTEHKRQTPREYCEIIDGEPSVEEKIVGVVREQTGGSNMDACAKTGRSDGEVTRELNSLSVLVDLLDKRTAMLQDHLGPILTSVPQDPLKDEKEVEVSSDMAQAIREMRNKLMRISNRVTMMDDTVAL